MAQMTLFFGSNPESNLKTKTCDLFDKGKCEGKGKGEGKGEDQGEGKGEGKGNGKGEGLVI